MRRIKSRVSDLEDRPHRDQPQQAMMHPPAVTPNIIVNIPGMGTMGPQQHQSQAPYQPGGGDTQASQQLTDGSVGRSPPPPGPLLLGEGSPQPQARDNPPLGVTRQRLDDDEAGALAARVEELEDLSRSLQTELDNVLEDRYQMQVALRAAQKELERLSGLSPDGEAASLAPQTREETALLQSEPKEEMLMRSVAPKQEALIRSELAPIPISTSNVSTQTPRPSRPPSAAGVPSTAGPDPANLARMQQLEGALRQATSDYQMLLTGDNVEYYICRVGDLLCRYCTNCKDME